MEKSHRPCVSARPAASLRHANSYGVLCAGLITRWVLTLRVALRGEGLISAVAVSVSFLLRDEVIWRGR
jgi:hypothetical protein